MARKFPFAALILFTIFLVASCANPSQTDPVSSVPGESVPYEGLTLPEDAVSTVPESDSMNALVAADFSVTDEGGAAVVPEGGVYTIKTAGKYTVTGTLENGQIIVDAGKSDEVTLILNGASVSNGSAPPILFKNASEAVLCAAEGTYNTVSDHRPSIDTTATDEENFDAAVYAVCDLKLTGAGSLTVTSAAGNGVKTKDDVKIRNLTLKITAAGNALKGNDSVTVESGSVTLISTGDDGIKTSNSDVSSKGNQRGTVLISGGSVDIYAACDGIDAAYNAVITAGETAEPTVNIFTASYADEAGAAENAGTLYAIVPVSGYSETLDYYAFFYNDDDNGVWRQFTYDTMVSGGRASYYGLVTNVPSGYANIAFYTVDAGQTPDGYTYEACSKGEALNTAMNAYLFSDITGNRISGDWVQLSAGGGSNKTAFSSKGMKAANEIRISDGTVTVHSMDDALHANGGEKLENGKTGLGNITVSGGRLSIVCADDGLHADGRLNISGSEIRVSESHEGLEANVIDISGGKTFVTADDDGLNACKGSITPLVNITGGYVDVTTPSGDTDGIDSNGNITVSGGFVLVKSGASMGGMAGSVDADGTVSVTGGTVVALGGVCETPGSGSVCTYISSGTSFSAGDYELRDDAGKTLLSFSLSSAYSSVWLSSDAMRTGGDYTMYLNGAECFRWSQTSSTVGSAVGWGPGGGMGPGGPGGGPGGPGGMGHRGG